MRFILLLLITMFVSPHAAFAACTVPTGNEGDINYSAIQHLMGYCNGTNWVAMGSSGSGGPTFGALTTNDFCIATNSTTLACNVASTGTGNVVLSASPTLTGTVTAGSFSGSGSGLTGIGTASLGGITGTPSSTTYLRGDGTWGTVSSSLTVATSTITGGTSGRVLYDNAGVLGEYVITGTGNVVMSASPVLTGTITAAAANFSGGVGIGTTVVGHNLANLEIVNNGGNSALEFLGPYHAASGSTLIAQKGDFATFTPLELVGSTTILGMLGNVGIGTTGPGQLLEVDGHVLIQGGASSATNYRDLYIGGIGGWAAGETHSINFVYNTRTSPIVFNSINSVFDGSSASLSFVNDYNSSTPAMYIKAGSVGIGTTSPTVALDVNGTVRATALTGNGSGLTGIGTPSLSATGTASSTTYLRGDGTWTTPPSSGLPTCPVYDSLAMSSSGWDCASNVYPRATYEGHFSATAGTTMTFTSVAFGDAAASRAVAIGVHYNKAATCSITSATIGGIAAQIIVDTGANSNSSDGAAILIASVPTGTSGSVVIHFSTAVDYAYVLSYAAYNLSSLTAFNTDSANSDGGNSQTLALNVPASGIAIGIAGYKGTGTATWTGLTQDDNYTAASATSSAAHDERLSSQSRSISVSWSSSTDNSAAVASFH